MDHAYERSPSWWAGLNWPAIRHEAHFGDRVLRCFHPRPPDLYALLQQAAERFGDNEAVVCGGTRLSWREVMRAATDLAAGLARLGVEDIDSFEIHNSAISPLVPRMVEYLYERLQRRGMLHRDVQRMVNVEELPAEPFLKALDVMGLPTRVKDEKGDRPWDAEA